MAGEMKAAVGLGPDEALAVLRGWGCRWVIALRAGLASHFIDENEGFGPEDPLHWLRRYRGAEARWDLVLTADGRTAICIESADVHADGGGG